MKRTVTYEFERGDMIVTTAQGSAWVAVRTVFGPVRGAGFLENNEWRATDGSFLSDESVTKKLESGLVKYIGSVEEFQDV